jgi:hypothetical protein
VLKTGLPIIDKAEKHTIQFVTNSTFFFTPRLSPSVPLNLDILPNEDLDTKKSLIEFFKKKTSADDKLLTCYRNLYRKIYFSLLNMPLDDNFGAQNNPVLNSANINFIRRERLYTKLKYSRSPAFDIVSGGAAALLAGFLGFLVSEKYGFELVDSGDFYYLFMYIVFLTFSIRPLLTAINFERSLWTLFSPKFFLDFYLNLLYLLMRKFK